MIRLTIITALTLISSCNKSTKKLDFGKFTIDAPIGWKAIKESGIDSYVGRIAIDGQDTLSFDLGWYSNSLEEEENQYDFTVIDNRKAKIVRPVNSGKGTTGVYIDSLWVSGSGTDKFQLSGTNLKSKNEALVLSAIRTIKFKK